MTTPFVSRRAMLAMAGVGVTLGLGSASAQTPKRGGTLRISVDQAPSKLNPLKQRVGPEYLLGEMLYSGLTRLGPDMTAQPDLALSWTANDTLTEWTFKRAQRQIPRRQRADVRDVEASFKAILDPATGCRPAATSGRWRRSPRSTT